MHSLLMVCNLLARSQLQKTVFCCFSYSSAKDISTTAQNASLSDTISFLEKESQPTGYLVSLGGIRFLFSCPWTIKSVGPLPRVALTGLLSGKQDTLGHLGTASLPEGCGSGGALPNPLLCKGLPYAVRGCSTCPHSLLFSSSQPLGFTAVPILLLPDFSSLGMSPHSHLLLPSHTAWQRFWSLQSTNHSGQTKGLSQVPRALHFTGNLRQNSHITLQVYRTDQKVTVSLVPTACFSEMHPIYSLM